MVHVKFNHCLLFILISSSGFSYADMKTLGDLDKLQSERFYYEAKAAAMKAKREADADNYLNSESNITSITPGRSEVLPSLVKISGHKANVVFSDGTTKTVVPGEVISGGRYQVVSISLTGVIVKRVADGKNFPLN